MPSVWTELYAVENVDGTDHVVGEVHRCIAPVVDEGEVEVGARPSSCGNSFAGVFPYVHCVVGRGLWMLYWCICRMIAVYAVNVCNFVIGLRRKGRLPTVSQAV